jgi:pimeloyl-ACP methyl ester carboxylesterase
MAIRMDSSGDVMPAHPHHPIIYVRGFAATQSEIDEAVADPYMGFNVGATKSRKAWSGSFQRFFFGSPLIRLMREYNYGDVFENGEDLLEAAREGIKLPYRCIIIHRYYDAASTDFGSGDTPPIEEFAKGLDRLILRLRDRVCGSGPDEVKPADFRVHLVAHSMGGLICRAFLQNPKLGSAEARAAVDKVFTYATPHNGIDMRIVRNVPGWATFGDINNFNRDRMSTYLALDQAEDVSQVANFPAERIFNLVGTNPGDYAAAKGISAWAAGEASDGLVRIQNAVTHAIDAKGKSTGSPRAFVHRSHSGHYGIVNSEEGYQNLVRFLFGTLRVDGILDVDDITLPVEVQKELDAGKKVSASYNFESAVSIRGCQWQITRRELRENSAIFRTYDQLFPGKSGTKRPPDRAQSPHLFSVFLDPTKSVLSSGSVSFALDLKILVPDYTVDGFLFMNRHYEGGYILRDLLLVEAFPQDGSMQNWQIKYGSQDRNPGKPGTVAETTRLFGSAGVGFKIPIDQKTRPGFRGTLRIEVRPWT